MSAPFEIALRVAPGDLDELGHVNNVVYVRWVQEAATAHWRALAPAADLETRVWVVLRHEIDYEKAARPGDEVIVRTWVGGARRLQFERHTEVLRAPGRERLARARTLWCPLDARTFRPALPSEEARRLFSAAGNGVRLRPAHPGDAEAVARLLDELGHPLPAEKAARQLAEIAGSGAFAVVAEAGGEVAGIATGFVTPVLHREAPVGRLSVLVVGRAHAGRGIGSMLLSDAEGRFRAAGCARAELTSAARRTEAHAFYRRRGWTEEGLRFTRDLVSSGTGGTS